MRAYVHVRTCMCVPPAEEQEKGEEKACKAQPEKYATSRRTHVPDESINRRVRVGLGVHLGSVCLFDFEWGGREVGREDWERGLDEFWLVSVKRRCG